MAKDYASQSRKKGKPKKAVRFDKKKTAKKGRSSTKRSALKLRWVLLFAIIVFIAVIVFLMQGSHGYNPGKSDQNPTVSFVKGEAVGQNSTSSTNSSQPAKSIKSTEAATQNTTAAAAPVNFQFTPLPQQENSQTVKYYMLQLGSFDPNDPELKTLRDQLHQMGLKYHMAQNRRFQDVFYRLELGPYHSSDSAETAWQQLAGQKIYAVIRPVTRG